MQLVDTNIISELVKPQPNRGVLEWLSQRQRLSSRLTLSAISADEIAFGVQRRPTASLLAWFDEFMQTHEVLPITGEIGRRAGELRAQLQAKGQARSQADMLIAATAQVHQLCIVTRNVRDFENCGVALLNPFS